MSDVTQETKSLPGHVGRSLAGAARDARRSFGALTLGAAVLFLLALFAPSIVSPSSLGPWAAALYLAAAAIGLDVALGIGGLPSLGQGAFVGIGAFTAALLLKHTGMDPLSAGFVGAATGATAGFVVGAGAVHLRAAFVVVVTWVFSWALFLSLSAFPALSGGAQGIVIEDDRVTLETIGRELRLDTAAHLRIALLLAALTLLIHRRIRTTSTGLMTRAISIDASGADALGIHRASLHTGLFVLSAALGGLVGGFAVQLAGVADPSSYGPSLSAFLFVIALLGSGAGSWVMAAGLILGALPLGLRAGFGGAGLSERFEPAAIAVALIVALVVSRSAWAQKLRARAARPMEKDPGEGDLLELATNRGTGSLRGEGLSKAFGGVVALDSLSIDILPGEIHALIGPNGSGKTTLLRMLSGTAQPDAGKVWIDDEDVTELTSTDRVRRGVVRTLQRSTVFTGLTVEQNLELGMQALRESSTLAEVVATPKARLETSTMQRTARVLIADSGLDAAPLAVAEQLSVYQQRILALLSAEATGARFFLLDEPAAGITARELQGLIDHLKSLKESGAGILIVDHHMRLIRAVSDRVTVVATGQIVARGSYDEVIANEEVHKVYPGLSGI